MAFASHLYMPGAHHSVNNRPAPSATLNANIFRPPNSPSDESSFNLAQSTASFLSENTSSSSNYPATGLGRKRTHDQSTDSNPYFDTDMSLEDSPRGRPNRYTLAGQIETLGTQSPPHDSLEESLYSDINYRRRMELGSKRTLDEVESSLLGMPSLPATHTGILVTPRMAGWTTFAFQAIGGVVGRVWEFCKGGAGGAFRGFKAGGGAAYGLNGHPVDTPGAPPTPPNSSSQLGAYFQADDISHTPVPHPIPDHQDHEPQCFLRTDQNQGREPSPTFSVQQPAVKRRQTSTSWEKDELQRNWVMVDEEKDRSLMAPRLALGAKRSCMPSAMPSRLPARSINMASRLQQQPRLQASTTAAHAAGQKMSTLWPRISHEHKSGIPAPTAPLLPRTLFTDGSNASLAGHAGSPRLSAAEPASFASQRSSAQQTPSPPVTPSPGRACVGSGSRIPQPKGLGPNPFAATVRSAPCDNHHHHHHDARVSPSRPSLTSRHSVHTAHTAHTPHRANHGRSLSSVSTSGSRGRPTRKSGLESVCLEVDRSPRLDDEARHLVSKRIHVEKSNDTRLDRLNGELQALIRQGQEALGTKVDVDMEDGDWAEN